MAVTLSDAQQELLHKAMLDYLHTSGFHKTYEQFKEEVPNVEDFDPNNSPKTKDLLPRKWTTVIRLQKKLTEVEARLAQALEELSQTSRGAKQGNVDWLPRTPAKHTLTSHRAPINAISFHPVYSSIVTASADSTLKVWDWETGDLERTLKGHTKSVTDCHYDSKGANLVSCSYDLFVKVWSVDNNYDNIATLTGHEHSISSVRFLEGDDRIISSSRDLTVRIWNLATRHCTKVIRGHSDWIRSAVPSSDGRLVLTCSSDHTAQILEIDSGKTKVEMRGHDNVVEVAIFVPRQCIPALRELLNIVGNVDRPSDETADTAYVATASRDKTVKIWDASTGTCVKTLVGHDNWVRSITFHPSGKYLLSAADDSTFKIWDMATGRCTRTVEAHQPFVSCIVWGSNGPISGGDSKGGLMTEKCLNVIATGGTDKLIKLWSP